MSERSSGAARTAVVTGGGTGIGAAVADTLARDGYQVTIVGRRSDVLADTAARIGARFLVADLSQPDEAAQLSGLGSVDVLVCAAGAWAEPPGDDLGGVDKWWRAMFDANVMTAVLSVEAMRHQLRGSVVLIGSIAAQRGGRGAYGAAKAALHGWMYDLAVQLGPRRVTVNVVCPGYVAGTELFGDPPTAGVMARRIGETLTGRVAAPQDVADAVLYLTRAPHVTGQVVAVNGGAMLGR
jgi:3-oxoacyl-[acyl-carrier protein] reductase